MHFRSSMTLAEARHVLRDLVDEGHECPVCTQFAKVYPRQIHSTMARALITMFRHGGREFFVHTASLPGDTHEISQLSWWGLIEEELVRRPDGGRAGWWRITHHGERFVRNLVSVPKYARIYDGRVLGLEGEPVTIIDALGKKFDYNELMRGES